MSRSSRGFSAASFPAAMPDYVVVELEYHSRVAFAPTAAAFAGPAEAEVSSINAILGQFDLKAVRPHFPLKKTDLAARVVAAPAFGAAPVDSAFALAGFVEVVPQRSQDCPRLVRLLNRHEAVWDATIAPRPEPAGAVDPLPNLEPAQGYLHDPPAGIGALAVWPRKAAGARVTVCDVEGNWNLTHRGLPPRIKLLGGEVITEAGWADHGTAVLGELVGRPEAGGVAGVCPKARAVVQAAVIDGVFNTAGAILNAAAKLKPGDVLLIELHARGGPDNRYVAMQFWDPVYAAIRTAVGMGIVVVEAAGNGGEDFDRQEYIDTALQKDAGAIVVGAGVPPTNYFSIADGPKYGFKAHERLGRPRSRLWFSNHGDIVTAHGWGWHVTTLGYGDATGGPDANRWSTHRFSGTSSAAPIVAGAVACIQSYAKARTGRPLTPAQVRDVLVRTGTPQADDAPRAPVGQQIGPLPDLVRALAEVDTILGT